MQIKQNLAFIIQSAIAGLIAAILYLYFSAGSDATIDGERELPTAIPSLNSYHSAVFRAAPAVVNVYASKVYKEQHPFFEDPLFQHFFGEAPTTPKKRRDNYLGSGVIMNEAGYVLTNAHVIRDANEIRVTLADGRRTYAKLIGLDTDTDLAVLHINMQSLPSIPLGDSSALRVGDVVLAIGNPYDFGQTVTQGIVSAMGRKRLGITTFEDFIQTDADINPGNSGGALINVRGDLIGINTAIISSSGGSQGIGLNIPVNQAIDIMRQIITNGRVVRGWLGIEAQLLSPDIVNTTGIKGGVMVDGVLQNGPAESAGIIPGDIITHIAGHEVMDPQQTIQLITGISPGLTIEITILRGWEQQTLKARVAQRPSIKKN